MWDQLGYHLIFQLKLLIRLISECKGRRVMIVFILQIKNKVGDIILSFQYSGCLVFWTDRLLTQDVHILF